MSPVKGGQISAPTPRGDFADLAYQSRLDTSRRQVLGLSYEGAAPESEKFEFTGSSGAVAGCGSNGGQRNGKGSGTHLGQDEVVYRMALPRVRMGATISATCRPRQRLQDGLANCFRPRQMWRQELPQPLGANRRWLKELTRIERQLTPCRDCTPGYREDDLGIQGRMADIREKNVSPL